MVRRVVAIVGLLVLAASCSCSDSEPVLAAEDGACVGTPAPCASFTEAEGCRRHSGCYWVYIGARCDENSPDGPRPCEQFTEPEGCVAQVGCWWR